MKRYAQIGLGGVVVGVSELSGVINAPHMIEIDPGVSVHTGQVWDGVKFVDREVISPRLIPARKLWRIIPMVEQVALLDSVDPAARAFRYEIELLNASGDLVDLDHPRFTAGLDALAGAGVFTVETVANLKGAL